MAALGAAIARQRLTTRGRSMKLQHESGNLRGMDYDLATCKALCPVCGGEQGKRLWSVDSDAAARHFLVPGALPEAFTALVEHIEQLWRSRNCDIVQCDGCSFVYSYPYVAGDKHFYDLAYQRTGYPAWKWEFQSALERIVSASSPNFRVLEIGAGNGAFVRRLTESGAVRPQNIVTTEYSDYGRSRIESLGIKCIPRDVRELQEGSFDAICMFQVLEHLDGLDGLFEKLTATLNRGGSLFLAVPNDRRIEFNETNGALLDMPPNHIGRWNHEAFSRIAERSGLRLHDHSVEPFSAPAFVAQFAHYRFLRRSQIDGTLESRLQVLASVSNSKFVRNAFRGTGTLIGLLAGIPAVLRINGQIGESQFAHLVKP
jgi:2-polyprenyl-3-methyl-5-hydroxy-6-metoxy-1,4-benzoquinol methylase